MDLYQVRYFLTIAETGSFSRAAERLYMSQPSLSTGIKKLEKEFGVSLFERGGRRTILTSAGRSFLKKATVIMEQYHAAVHELKGLNEQPVLQLGVPSTMRVEDLARFVSIFQQHHPNVVIDLHEGTLEQLQKKLEHGDIDVALTVLSLCPEPDSAVKDNSHNSIALFKQPLLLAVANNHPLAQRTSVRLAEIDDQPYIDRINCEFFKQECEILKEENVQPKVIYRASHEEWVISLIKAGLGISIMPVWHGLTDITYLPISDLGLQRTIGIQWRQQHSSELVEQFCHFAASHNWESINA